MTAMFARVARVGALGVLLFGAFALAVVAFPLARYPANPPSSVPSGAVAIVRRQVDRARQVELRLEWEPDRSAVLARGGLITAMAITPGSSVECGRPVAALDGRAVVAYCGPGPLWREVTADSEGFDAAQAWDFLRSTGLLVGDTPTWSERNDAIRAFRDLHQLGDGPALDPADLVWMPAASQADEVVVQLGQRVEQGTTIFVDRGNVSKATVTGLPADPAPEDFVVTLPSLATALAVGPDGTIADVSAVTGALGAAGRVDGTAVAAVDATARLAEPVAGWAVPASSIQQGTSGNCVGIRRDGQPLKAVAVEVLGYSVGTALVTGALEDQDVVVVNPGSDLRC